jgi:1-acyl-sn-glycerol-3-phosphate acyltransferase
VSVLRHPLPGRFARGVGQAIGPRITRGIFAFVTRVHRLQIGEFPRSGGVILACNHISHFDPPLIGTYSGRSIDWLGMEELFRKPLAARALALLGVIPVNRHGADRTAIRIAVRRLGEGRAVGIFPEGGIRAGETSILNGAPMRPGAAALSVLSRRPLIPCVILGSDRLYQKGNWRPWHRVPVWMGFGAPLAPPPHLDKAAARADVQQRLAAAIIDLKERLIAHFHLRPGDLPTTPQARKGEDPYDPAATARPPPDCCTGSVPAPPPAPGIP